MDDRTLTATEQRASRADVLATLTTGAPLHEFTIIIFTAYQGSC